MFDNIGTTELVIIGVIILIFFGGNKLKEVARGLGESSKEIKKAKKEFEDAVVDIKAPPENAPLKPRKKKLDKNPEPKLEKGGTDNV